MLAVLLVTLRLTLPAFDADTLSGCEPGPMPCRDLDSLFLEAQPVNPVAPVRSLARLSVRGHEGQPLTLDLPLSPDSAYAVSAYTRDISGNPSCPAWIALGAWPLAVAPAPAAAKLEWFDVAGRRVTAPSAPGVYLWRRGRARGRVVVVR